MGYRLVMYILTVWLFRAIVYSNMSNFSLCPWCSMQNLQQLKSVQQESYLRSLKEALPVDKEKIALNNSGFAMAIRNNRQSVVIKFSR